MRAEITRVKERAVHIKDAEIRQKFADAEVETLGLFGHFYWMARLRPKPIKLTPGGPWPIISKDSESVKDDIKQEELDALFGNSKEVGSLSFYRSISERCSRQNLKLSGTQAEPAGRRRAGRGHGGGATKYEINGQEDKPEL